MGSIGTDKSVPFQNSGIHRVFPQPVKPAIILLDFMYGLKRLRKNSLITAGFARTIPQGLKPESFYRLYWHG
jgi:hypothetical protein